MTGAGGAGGAVPGTGGPTPGAAGGSPAGTGGPPAGRGRRALAYTVLLCVAGAALALFAATRTWAVEVTPRPAPLPAIRLARAGGDLLPWLPALALVGLAGAGAVLATRGRTRRAVGGLLTLVGAAVAGGAGAALLDPASGAAGPGWPLLCGAGGLLLAAGGAGTAARGQRWPAMGARYERGARPAPPTGHKAGAGHAAGTRYEAGADDPAGPRDESGRRDGPGVSYEPGARHESGGAPPATARTWDALDRGEDPTLTDPDEPRRPD